MIEVKEDLFILLVNRYFSDLKNRILDWSHVPLRDDENPIDELYQYKHELQNIPEYEYFDDQKRSLNMLLNALLERHAPEETIPDSWDRA